jgi:CRP-like cAMP-binding protein
LLDDMPRMAQARAETACTLAVMARGEFLGLLETHAVIASKISLQLARHLGQRLRAVQDFGGES